MSLASLHPILQPIGTLARDWAAALGVGGVLWTTYSASGLPIPATIHQVEVRIAVVNESLKGIKVDQLDGRRETIRLSRISLRNEKGAIERVIADLDTTSRATMNRRVGEIDDQLKELDAKDAELRQRITELQPK